MIEFIDPRGESATATEAYSLSYQLGADGSGPDGAATTVGLLANGFPDSESFLDAVGVVLQERMPNIRLKAWNKGNASVTVSEEMLDEIVGNCQIAIAAYGH